MRWVRSLLHRQDLEDRLDKELRFHFESQVQDHIARGMTEDTARRRVRMEFGGLDHIKDECRDQRPLAWLVDLRQDLSVALRGFGRSPGFAAVCVITLGVTIGANTTVFSLLHTLVLHSLPYAEPDRLTVLWTDDPKHDTATEGVSLANFEDWRRLNRTFDAMEIFVRTNDRQLTLSGQETPERVQIAAVSTGLFRLLGVAPIRGRMFTEEEQEKRLDVVLISERLWTNHFSHAGHIMARKLELNGKPVEIVGVLPGEFQFPYWNTDIWFPYTSFFNHNHTKISKIPVGRYNDWLGVVGRLKPRISIDQARADMARVASILAQEHPEAPKDFAGFGVTVLPIHEQHYGSFLRPALWILFGAVIAVLLIGCSNVGSLLLARAENRIQEFAVRRSLGAGSSRLIRQLLAESALLALAAAFIGLGLAQIGLRMAVQIADSSIPRLDRVEIHGLILLFSLAIAVGTALLCGCFPAWRIRRDSDNVLQGRRGTAGNKTRYALNGLVVCQVALAMVLCTVAGLLLRSFLMVNAAPLGYKPEQMLIFDLVNRSYGFASPREGQAHGIRVAREVIERMQSLPGVTGVAYASELFLERHPDGAVIIDGIERSDVPFTTSSVSRDFFSVLGVRLVSGRFLLPEEELDSRQRAAIINETMARHFWPNQDPVGRTFGRENRPWTIVGVVEDMRLRGREKKPVAHAFLPAGKNPWQPRILVRTQKDPVQLVAAIRNEVRRVDQGAVVHRLMSVEKHLDQMQAPRTLQASLVGIFSILAIGLAVFGSYSVLQYATAQRAREFGIRAAMGATASGLMRLVLRRGMAVAAVGIAIGLLASFWLTHLLAGLLYGVSPLDGTTFAGSAVLLILALAAASLAPAYRSSRANPVDCLRQE